MTFGGLTDTMYVTPATINCATAGSCFVGTNGRGSSGTEDDPNSLPMSLDFHFSVANRLIWNNDLRGNLVSQG